MKSHAMHAELRRGVTLLELLIVIGILLLLTTATITAFVPSLSERRIRETARQISIFISTARNRAIETGRPVGVMFERMDANVPEACVKLTMVEVPPPYSGEQYDSVAAVTGSQVTEIRSSAGLEVAQNLFVLPGDKIQFGYQGPIYTITPDNPETYTDTNSNGRYDPEEPYFDANGNNSYDSGESFVDVNGDGTWTAGEPFDDANGAIPDVYEPCPLPWNLDPAPPSGFTGGPFQIFRQPVPSPSGSLELPESVVIDLNFSGTETWPFHPRDFVSAPASPYVGSPIEVYSLSPMFTFNPSGDIDRVWCNWRITSNATVYEGRRIASPIYLLVGLREKVPLLNPVVSTDSVTDAHQKALQMNWRDLSARWLMINSQGTVTVAENTAPPDVLPLSLGEVVDISQARTIVRSNQTMGGR